MTGYRFLKLGVALVALPLSGCETVGGWADAMGNHMPVVGDRCEHWQCFTSSGQAQSDAITAQKEKERKVEQRGTPLMTSQEAAAQQKLQQEQQQNASMSGAAQAQYQQYMQQQQQPKESLPLYYDYPASSGGTPPAEPVQDSTSQPY